MKVLIVKLSSLGDVVHAMPAVQDIRSARTQVRVDWVVEASFAPLVARCTGVTEVIGCELRRWMKSPLAAATRSEWNAFRERLCANAYDAVIDLQGLTKSALIARTARLSPGGRRFAMANRTDGSSYEAPTRWVADVAIPMEPHSHAVTRARELCSKVLGYDLPGDLNFGLRGRPTGPSRTVCFVHGTSRDDKCWPEPLWIELGRRLGSEGYQIALPQGNEAEMRRSERMAAALGAHAQVWPRLDLAGLTDRMSACAGVVGVDSGLSHIAVALDLPHVQIYNFDTAWRTGPLGSRKQKSIYSSPHPSVDAVWQAWAAVQRIA